MSTINNRDDDGDEEEKKPKESVIDWTREKARERERERKREREREFKDYYLAPEGLPLIYFLYQGYSLWLPDFTFS